MMMVPPDPTARGHVRRLALVVLACLLGFTLWVPGFHHHESEHAAAHCTLCLTVAVQSWDLPSATATLPLPLSADGRSLLAVPAPKPRVGVDRRQAPRGPPLT